MEIDRSLIGAASKPFVVEVEKGAILRFAEAIGDPNPIYRDEKAARAAGYEGVVAPPTFPVTFRASEEPVWTRDLDRRRILAGEQSFHYERPIVAGDRLECRIHFIEVIDKEGRSGKMEMLVQEVRGADIRGRAVFTHRRVTVYRERKKAP